MNRNNDSDIIAQALLSCIEGRNSTIYAVIANVSDVPAHLYNPAIVSAVSSTHLFELDLIVNEEDRSIHGSIISFKDKNNPFIEFVYDTCNGFHTIASQFEFIQLLDDYINKAVNFITIEFNKFMSERLGIASFTLSENNTIDDLIELKIESMFSDSKTISAISGITNYEQYSYRMSNFKSNKQTIEIKNVNTDPNYKQSKANDILSKFFSILIDDLNDDVEMIARFRTVTSVGQEFIAVNKFESNYVFGDKLLAMTAFHGDNEIMPLIATKYIDNDDSTDCVKEDIANTLFSTLELLHKVTSETVDITIQYNITKNDGVFV